jgi:hypothetical protein
VSTRGVTALAAGELAAFVMPLRRVADDPEPPRELIELLAAAGWGFHVSEQQAAAIGGTWADVTAVVDDLAGLSEPGDALAFAQGLAAVGEAIAGARAAGEALEDPLRSIDGIDAGELLGALGEDLLHMLTIGWLERRHPVLRELLTTLGLIRPRELPELSAGTEGPVLRMRQIAERVEAAAVPALLGDPIGELRAVYGLTPLADSATAEAMALLFGDRLGRFVDSLGGYASIGALDELDADPRGVALSLPLPARGSVRAGPQLDLLLRVLSPADTGASGRRGPGIELELPGWEPASFSIGGRTLAIAAPPLPGALFIGPDGADTGGAGRVTISADARPRHERRLILGGASGLDLALPELRLFLDMDGDADFGIGLVSAGSRLTVKAGEGDSFLRALLAGIDFELPFDLGVEWSRSGGIALSGTVGLVFRVPLNLTLGPLSLTWLDVLLTIEGELVELAAAVELDLELGPFAVTIDGLGVAATLDCDAGEGNLGPVDLALRFRPPTRVVLVLESEVVSGGGFVAIEPATGRYAGGLALDAFGVGIGAIVVVDTELPGDPDGFALFASLGVTFPTPLPLGFGFTLIGVGGLLALNRTIDVDELALALRTGAADSILFPEDIEEDAEAVLAGLDLWFPTKQGTTVVGPVAELGWGSPTLISAQLGVVVAIPDLIVTLLGSLEMLLPTPDEALLSLRMDVIGAVDVPASTVTVAASLHDSNLLGIFELSGDMGFYSRLAEQPLFVLSIGGYHPQFDPPGALPAWLLELRRVRAAVPLGLGVEVVLTSYVAVTSNTLQFGGRVRIVASVEVLLTTYTAEGWFGVNVLLVLKPFKLVARATAGVAVTAGDRELLGVQLVTRLEGPEPWYATGRASFKFFGLPVEFGFDIGSQPGGEPREQHPVGDDVVTAMTPPTGWEVTDSPDAWASGVVLAEERPAGLWARPDQLVEVRQSVAPLNRTITAYGEFVPDTERIDAGDVTLGGAAVAEPEWVDDWFAPAQFDRLDDSARLSAPSYELMTAGVRFGDAGVAISADAGECTSVTREPEESIWPDVRATTSAHVSPARPAAYKGATRSVTGPELTLAPTTYTLVDRLDGLRARGAGDMSYAEAHALAGARVRVVPSHAAVERVTA